jgi:hypothetical protein
LLYFSGENAKKLRNQAEHHRCVILLQIKIPDNGNRKCVINCGFMIKKNIPEAMGIFVSLCGIAEWQAGF